MLQVLQAPQEYRGISEIWVQQVPKVLWVAWEMMVRWVQQVRPGHREYRESRATLDYEVIWDQLDRKEFKGYKVSQALICILQAIPAIGTAHSPKRLQLPSTVSQRQFSSYEEVRSKK
jgi:hypothetical protein